MPFHLCQHIINISKQLAIEHLLKSSFRFEDRTPISKSSVNQLRSLISKLKQN